MREYIKKENCIKRHIYIIHSRNLIVGLYNEIGFIGIREKFGHEYLFTEFHTDDGPPFGTVSPKKDIGILPENIPIIESIGTIDYKTKRPVYFDKSEAIENERIGMWKFEDTNEHSKDIKPVNVENEDLFQYLKTIEKKFKKEIENVLGFR